MPRVTQSFGDRGKDEEIDRLWAEVERLKASAGTKTTERIVTQVVSAAFRVQSADATISMTPAGLEIDTASGLSLTLDGSFALLSLRIPVRTDDPASPAEGQVWYRSDLAELRIYDGTNTKKSAFT